MQSIYKVVAGSESGSDTTSVSVVRVVPRDNNTAWSDTVCECFDWEAAVLICALLNGYDADHQKITVQATLSLLELK